MINEIDITAGPHQSKAELRAKNLRSAKFQFVVAKRFSFAFSNAIQWFTNTLIA